MNIRLSISILVLVLAAALAACSAGSRASLPSAHGLSTWRGGAIDWGGDHRPGNQLGDATFTIGV